jgi:hypothetical protein
LQLEKRIHYLKSRPPDPKPPSGDSALIESSESRRHDLPRRTAFLCYRRDDTQDAAGRLYDSLAAAYGPDNVFMDIDSLPLGVNFVAQIQQQLQDCAAALVMIGRSWTTITNHEGNRRLDDPTDHVRVEVATALRQKIPVIPILVQNASMPREAELPEDIRDLAFYNGIRLSPEFWRAGVEKLIKELDRVMKTRILKQADKRVVSLGDKATDLESEVRRRQSEPPLIRLCQIDDFIRRMTSDRF